MRVTFLDSGREPKCPPNPDHPNGIDLDLSSSAKHSCLVQLPYPAPRCGQWMVGCDRCHQVVVITCAGRADDPRSIKLACRFH